MDIEMLNVLKSVNDNLSRIAESLDRLASPDSKKKRRSPRQLHEGLRDPEVREVIFNARRRGFGYKEIAALLLHKYPNHPEKHIPKNTIWNFVRSAIDGHYVEFGIRFP